MEILILDIETSGFLQAGGTIIEIGVVSLDLRDGTRRILVDELCREDSLTREHLEKSWIVKNSDINIDNVMNSKKLSDLRPKIQEVINSYQLGATAYNNVFDFGFMEAKGFTFPKKLSCPMKLSTNICKIPKAGNRGYKWPKVQEAYDFFFGKTDYIEMHRGADDAFHEAKIVYKLYELGVFKIE